MRWRTLGVLTIGLCLYTTNVLATPHVPSRSDTKYLKAGESTEITYLYQATEGFYAATSNRSICQVSFSVDIPTAIVTVYGVSKGECKVFLFDNNTLMETFNFEVTDEQTPPYSLVPCYQFYSAVKSDHYYTTDKTAIDKLGPGGEYASWGYVYEGIAYYVYKKNED